MDKKGKVKIKTNIKPKEKESENPSFPESNYGVKSIREISRSRAVMEALEKMVGLEKPKVDIKKFLDDAIYLHEKNTDELEKYLAVYTSWQSYFNEQAVVTAIILAVAESQVKEFWSYAVADANGTVNLKKDLASSDPAYKEAVDVMNQAKAGWTVTDANLNSCERAFRLTSRILSKRLNVKEW